MIRKFTLGAILLIAVIQLQAQTRQGPGGKLTITGNVIDAESGQGLEFATISLHNSLDSSVVNGSLTGTGGGFELSTRPGNYYLKAEFISYESISIDSIDFSNSSRRIDLGSIVMRPESMVLDDVVITAERSETVFALDKRVFTVGKDLANRGGSAEDILDNVPSVTVDIDGNVSLRGSGGVRILIDGRPSGLVGIGNSNGLRNIAANMIEKVEVITNPSARYEAEGMAGIINIILKKNEASGFNGSFDGTLGYPARNGASANLNYRKNRINWFINYGINYRERPGGGFAIQDQATVDPLTGQDLRQFTVIDRDQNRNGISNSFRFGLDYFFTENDQLTASFLYRKSDDDNFSEIIFDDYIAESQEFDFDPFWERDVSDLKKVDSRAFAKTLDQDLLYRKTRRTDTEFEDEKNLEYSLNYSKEFSSREHKLNASLQFREKSEVEGSELVSDFDNSLPGSAEQLNQRSNNSEGEETWLLQVDYVHPLGKDHKWETGIRSSKRQVINDYIVEEEMNGEFEALPAFTNNFVYDEDIHAAYFIYGNTLDKFSYQVGLRTEYTLINTELLESEEDASNKRDFFNFFPSGFINYNFSEANALQASYSRRIDRPGFWSLNPFFTFSDNRNFFSGNPNINPEYTDSYEIGQILYLKELTVSSSLFYRHTEDSNQRVLIADRSNATTLRVPINIGTVDDYGLDISVNYSGLKWLRLDGNWNIFRNRLSLSDVETDNAIYAYYRNARNFQGSQEEFQSTYDYNLNETDNVTWNGRITARITLFNSDLQIRTNYRGGRQTSQGRSNGIASVDIGWSMDFLESKNLSITLSIRDLFNSRRRDGFTVLDDFYQQSDFQWRARTASITASYRINQKKNRRSNGGRDGSYDGGDDF